MIDPIAKSFDECLIERNIQEAISPMLISLLIRYARKARDALQVEEQSIATPYLSMFVEKKNYWTWRVSRSRGCPRPKGE